MCDILIKIRFISVLDFSKERNMSTNVVRKAYIQRLVLFVKSERFCFKNVSDLTLVVSDL
jgi:hypothetical protein